jgi:cell division protease FtsH
MKKPRRPTISEPPDQTFNPDEYLCIAEAEEPSPPRDPAAVVAQYMLENMLNANPTLGPLATANSKAIIVTVPAQWASLIAGAWSARFYDGIEMANGNSRSAAHLGRHGFPVVPRVAFIGNEHYKPTQNDDAGEVVGATLSYSGSVIGFAAHPSTELPAALLDAVDMEATAHPLDIDTLVDVLADITGSKLTIPINQTLVSKVSPNSIRFAVRPAEPADEAIRRLMVMAERHQKVPDISLDDLGGMPEAIDWGKALALDLEAYRDGTVAWHEVDRGALLSGPPGCGKTTFAKALAGSCGVPLIASSLGEWQASGHLGDLLKAMRKTFEAARQASPCILLIDEVDGFGSRSNFNGSHVDYSTQVVNGFLELLDGATARDGVVVIGATNYPERLDPAITRSGRLDRHIRISLPNQAAIIKIMRKRLGTDLTTENLEPAGLLAIGATGADIERWVRGAKRVARHERRPMKIDDLITEIRGNTPSLSEEILHRCAVHEAGHALAIAISNPNSLCHVTIRQTESTGGGVISHRPNTEIATGADIDQILVSLLSGRAAEELVIGNVSSGAGGGPESDLGRATMIATAAITALGLGTGSTVIWSGSPRPDDIEHLLTRRPDVARQIEERLDTAYRAAKSLLAENMASLRTLIECLLERESLAGSDVLALLGIDARTAPDGDSPKLAQLA